MTDRVLVQHQRGRGSSWGRGGTERKERCLPAARLLPAIDENFSNSGRGRSGMWEIVSVIPVCQCEFSSQPE